MKIHNVRFGFATNSSSSHSIIMLRPGHTVDEVPNEDGSRWSGYQFGWEFFRLSDVDEKTKYVVAQFVSNLRGKLNFYETQSLIKDIFGVEVSESEYGSTNFPDIGVDHQSVLSISSENTDFWKGLHQFVLRDDVVILGGNDNSDDISPDFVPAPYDKVDWLDEITDTSSTVLKTRKDGDVFVFFNSSRGTKVRVDLTTSSEPYTKASTPELVDLKITQFCNMGCGWCYQSSTTAGLHAPKERIFKIIRQLKKLGVFEIAIGGGEPTLHPNFIEILRYARKNDVVPNFTTYNLSWMKNSKIVDAVANYAGGVGVSVHKLGDIQRVLSVRDRLAKSKSATLTQPKVMAQHVLGTLSMTDTSRLIEYSIENYVPLLILGYKDVGFGSTFTPEDFTDFPMVLKLAIGDVKKWCQISVDTAILQQYPDLLKVLEVNEVKASSEEGKFSCYIDAVTEEMGPSSYAPSEMSALPSTYRGIKNLFATY